MGAGGVGEGWEKRGVEAGGVRVRGAGDVVDKKALRARARTASSSSSPAAHPGRQKALFSALRLADGRRPVTSAPVESDSGSTDDVSRMDMRTRGSHLRSPPG